MPSREVAPDGGVKFVTRIMHFPGLQSTFSVFLEDAIGKSADSSFRERGA
jgi:hypothetical protein